MKQEFKYQLGSIREAKYDKNSWENMATTVGEERREKLIQEEKPFSKHKPICHGYREMQVFSTLFFF